MLTQFRGRPISHAVYSQKIFDGVKPLKLFAAAIAACDMSFGTRCIGCIELTIDEAAKHKLLVRTAGHY